MANHMAEVAKMLGVELREEFKLVSNNGSTSADSYYFVEGGIYNVSKGYFETPSILINLLTGFTTIKYKPWKPKDGECYYLIEPDRSIGIEEWRPDNSVDMNYYKLGNCYRTREEAEANRDKWIKFYASDEVMEG